MGNRKQPFGYRMTLGEITIQPEEAELVRFIFQGYSTGATLGELTKALCRQEIPYYEGRTWNKNMVSRILEDSRYIGEKGYPALIEPEQLRTAAEKRTARACPPQKTPAQKTLRRLCGAPPSERVEKIVTDLLNELIRCPDRIQPAASQMAAACGKTREDLTTSPSTRTTPEHCSFNWRQSNTTPLGTRNTKPCGCGGCSPAANP